MQPLVSVVIPTHNRAEFLRSAIDSALAQEGGPLRDPDALEVIVVDDLSSDHTPAVVAGYRDAIKALRNSENLERGASRNRGAVAARGKWLAFLDSDDEWESDKLDAQLAALGEAEASVTGYWLTDEEGGLLGTSPPTAADPGACIELFNPYHAAPSSLLIDRALFLSLGGFVEDRALQGSEDWLFMTNLVRSGCEPVVIDRPLVRYRRHDGNSTANPAGYLAGQLAAVNWMLANGLSSPERHRQAFALTYESAARAHLLRGELRRGTECLRLAAEALSALERTQLLGRTARAAALWGARRARNGARIYRRSQRAQG
ncbi:MAG TPA: glycosyltransferase family A protein [Solirubrobacteraceae bacterium]|nr:glycosyltransferase family A protein [Solirubrobacteraceae bacterium]